MNKSEFLSALSAGIGGLPQSDIDKALEYYSEMIDDRVEDGCTEEEAVRDLGSIDNICRQILMEAPLPHLVKAAAKPNRTLRAWEIVLLVLGSPVWVPLAFTALLLILVFWFLLWVMAAALYAIDLSLALASVASLFQACVMAVLGRKAEAVMCFGSCLVCFGIAVLMFFAAGKISLLCIKLCNLTLKGIKSIFISKSKRGNNA